MRNVCFWVLKLVVDLFCFLLVINICIFFRNLLFFLNLLEMLMVLFLSLLKVFDIWINFFILVSVDVNFVEWFMKFLVFELLNSFLSGFIRIVVVNFIWMVFLVIFKEIVVMVSFIILFSLFLSVVFSELILLVYLDNWLLM